ncbi:MAG: LacI family DNA-binding transcriptional regulator [Rhodothermales bacterium]
MSVTIYDIANEAGVSIATVSRVFNNHPRVSDTTRARILDLADTMGYMPHVSARSLAQQTTNLVSAVIPMLGNYFFIEVIRGLQDRLAESDFDLLVYSAHGIDDVDAQLERALQRGRSAGVMLFSTPLLPQHVKRLKRRNHPVVLVDSFHPEFDSVSVDNTLGGKLATQHLIEEGCTRIGLISGNALSVPARDRREGYQHALSEAGLTANPRLVAVSDDEEEHGYNEREGYALVKQLLESGVTFDGLFVASDIQALGVLRALHDHGIRCPEEVKVVGFDDIKISEYVGLSTMRQPMYEMGRLAVEKTLHRIGQPDHPTSHTLFAPKLIGRDTSTGNAGTPSGVNIATSMSV